MNMPSTARTFVCSTARNRKGDIDLHVDLYCPEKSKKACPLVVWVHAGGFRNGSRINWTHPKIARLFNDEGYAFAAVDYRLARPRAVLTPRSEACLPELIAEGERACPDLNATFRGARPIAVVEDICRFFSWIAPRCKEFGLSGEYILAGASAGGLSVLNTLFLASHLGFKLPYIRSAMSLSGGFAFPRFIDPNITTPILAIHNPADDKVAFSASQTIKTMLPDQVELVIANRQKHGFPMVIPEEPLAAGIGRLIAFDRRMQNELPVRIQPLVLDGPTGPVIESPSLVNA